MRGYWIYFNEKYKIWEVKYWDGHSAVVEWTFESREKAFRRAAWGV